MTDEPVEQGPPPPDPVTAEGYCEATVEMFCDYYLRCGRMAADSVVECRATFLEICNDRYEPHYIALEQRGALELSQEGLAACQSHLATVECSHQIFDLDGPCQQLWQGQISAGGGCGMGIESFVCDDGSTCVIGMDLCGTCQPVAAVGQACGDGTHCAVDADCVGGLCVPRALPGEPCGDEQPCVLGASCAGDLCTADSIVAIGDGCDATHDCPYRAACVGSQCVQTGLAGDPCGPGLPCAGGWCDDGTCALLVIDGEPCESPVQCVSGVCDGGLCGALPGPCFE